MSVLTDKLEIKINGKHYEDYEVVDVILIKGLLQPNELRFSMRKKSLLKTKEDIAFNLSNELLKAKVECTVKTVYRDENEDVKQDELKFEGIIFNVSLRKDTMGDGALVYVTAFSPDYLLKDNPHCYSFEEKSLKTIVEEAISDYSGDISTTINPRLQEPIPYVVQYNESTYEFLSRLAQRYGEFFYYENGSMIFGELKSESSVTLYPDVDIIGYDYELNMEHPNFSHGHHNYLDYENSSDLAINYSQQSLHPLTDYAYNHSKTTFSKTTFQNLHSSTAENNSINQLEKSLQAESLGSKSQMMVCRLMTNKANLCLGSKIIIEEFFDKDNGKQEIKEHEKLLVCKIVHKANVNGHYENEAIAVAGDTQYPPYTNYDLYPVTEQQRAIVKDNQDPEKLGRIRVQFLWQELQDESLLTPWIRIAQPHGGGNKGFYFIPEIDEEVMVGFENGNAEKPYVIGTLYHGQAKPPDSWYNDSDDIKAIRTRSGHTIEFHDTEGSEFIKIYDNEKDNFILTFSTHEQLIKLESKGNIELYADNDVIIEAKNNVNIKAGVDMNREAGENITETAGKNISTSAGEDISIDAGNNMSTNVSKNDSIYVGSNQTIEIGSNKDEMVTKKYQLTAENIREEANQKMQIYSQTHEQKADREMKLDGGGDLDLYGKKVKIN
jgi:Rhs element Vgr protein